MRNEVRHVFWLVLCACAVMWNVSARVQDGGGGALVEAGDLLVGDSMISAVFAFDPDDGMPVATVAEPGPWRFMALNRDQDDNYWMSSWEGLWLLAHSSSSYEYVVPSYSLHPDIRFISDSCLAPDGMIFLASGDFNNRGRIHSFVPETGAIREVFSWGFRLQDVVTGPDGLLYVTTYESQFVNRLLRVDPFSGQLVDEFLPPGSGGSSQYRSTVFAANGDLLVEDHGFRDDRVLRFDGETGEFIEVFVSASEVGEGRIWDIRPNGEGNVYLATTEGLFVKPETGGRCRQLVADTPGDGTLTTLEFTAHGDVVVFEELDPPYDSWIPVYHPTTGALVDMFPRPFGEGGLAWPNTLVIAQDSTLFCQNSFTNRIIRFDPASGTHVGTIDTPHWVYCIAIDSQSRLYAGHGSPFGIWRYDARTGDFLDVFASNAPVAQIRDMLFHNGLLWVISSSWNGESVRRLDAETGEFVDVFLEPDDLRAFVVDPQGDILVSTSYRGIERYDSETGDFLGTFVPLGQGGLSSGLCLAIGPDDNLYVSDVNSRILKFHGMTGQFLGTVAEQGSGGLFDPRGLAFVPPVLQRPAALTDFNIAFGQLLSGGLAELGESDDTYLRVRSAFGFSASEPNLVDVRLRFTTDVLDALDLFIAVESRLNTAGGAVRWRLRNWATNALEPVREHDASTVDEIKSLSMIDATNRVRPSDGVIELSWRAWAVATFSAAGFDARLDHVIMNVRSN